MLIFPLTLNGASFTLLFAVFNEKIFSVMYSVTIQYVRYSSRSSIVNWSTISNA